MIETNRFLPDLLGFSSRFYGNPHLLAEVASWAPCAPRRCGDGVAVDACLGLLEAEDLAA